MRRQPLLLRLGLGCRDRLDRTQTGRFRLARLPRVAQLLHTASWPFVSGPRSAVVCGQCQGFDNTFLVYVSLDVSGVMLKVPTDSAEWDMDTLLGPDVLRFPSWDALIDPSLERPSVVAHKDRDLRD